MASAAKRRSKGSKASDGKRKRRDSNTDEDEPAFLSSKYAERPTSKIYNSRFNVDKPAELFRKDLISAMKMPDSEPLVPEEYRVIDDSWKPEWERGVQVPVFPNALPRPKVRALRKRNKEVNIKLPKKLIRFTRDSFFNPEVHTMSYTNTLAERTCRYDMDAVDSHWLTSVNQDREDFGLQPLEETFVEQVIEEFEEQAYINFQDSIKSEEGLGVEYDEDAICDVCRSPDSVDGNEMVFCDSCNICVHQVCYGITKIPEGSWICRTCALGIRPPCVLCPNRGGAMKTTRCGQKWAHVGCAVWIPEVSFFNFVKMEPIIKISQIPASKWNVACSLCKEKTGVCITCSENGCKATFHVTCAFNEGLQMRAVVKNSDCDDEDVFKAFCSKHSMRRSAIGLNESEDSPTKNAKDSLTSEERANIRQQKIQEKEGEFYNYVNIDDVSDMFQSDKADIETIFHYWKLKRKVNWNRALLTPKIDTENNCNEEDSPISFLKRMVHHRQDLERVRNLCYMVIKREKQMAKWTDIKQTIFLKQINILRKEGRMLSDKEKEAVLKANLGDIAYDKKFSGMNDRSPNVISVLSDLVGKDVAKTQINGLLKSPPPKNKDHNKTGRTPNPYAKHYLNGLVKRSQRWFPVGDKEKKVNLEDSASLHKSTSNETLDHRIKIESPTKLNVLEEQVKSDDQVQLSNEQVISDVVDPTKQNSGTSPTEEINDSVIDSSLSNATNGLDVYNYLCPIESDPDSLCVFEGFNTVEYEVSSEDVKLECISDSESTKGEVNFSAKSDFVGGEILESGFDSTTSQDCSLDTGEDNRLLADFKTESVYDFGKEKMSPSKIGDLEEKSVEVHSSAELKNGEAKSGEAKAILIPVDPCKEDRKNKVKDEADIQNLKKEHPKRKFKEISDSTDVETVGKSETKNVLGRSHLKVSLNRNLALQIEQNHVKLPQPFVVLKSEDIVHCDKNKDGVSIKVNKAIRNCDKLNKKSSLVNSGDKSNETSVLRDKSTINNSNSKTEDKSEVKFRPVFNKNSPARTQSPSHTKFSENEMSKVSKSSPKHNLPDKGLSKTSAPKLKNLSISLSPLPLSVNKRASSPLAKCQEKTVSSPPKSEDPREKLNKQPPLPMKDTLRGYKIPKKPKTSTPEESGLGLKRGNSPLSPLPDITSSGLSSYNSTSSGKSSWRKLEPRSEKGEWKKLNGDTQLEDERLVVKLKKDVSDPKSQRWLSDSGSFNGTGIRPTWMNDFIPGHVPRLLPPPLPPFAPVGWAPMRTRGGYPPMNMNYRPGPYT